jgi:hypothetical protein
MLQEVLVPVENMSLQAKAEYNQYAAAQGLPQYNSQMGSSPMQVRSELLQKK